MPPRDAVFLAEMINYFPYGYPQPAGEDPVSLTAEIAACPWNAKHKLVRIGVKAKQIDPENAPPRNLVFLIDTSGSMAEPTRLPLVKKSLALLIDRLRRTDTVSIVSYAGDAMLKLGPTPGSKKAKIRGVVEALDASGSTNGGGGIRMAYDHARLNFIEGGVNRVILCTDGDFNVGVTSEGELVRLIEQQRKSNVFLTCLGYGMGNLKNATMEQLANHGNGHYAYG
jgi:Ca-activated chloride channel family protein